MNGAVRREPVEMPDLGIRDVAQTLSVWLVPLGTRVSRGDRLVEVVAGQAVVDIPAPDDGVLVQKCVLEDQVIETAEILGWIACSEQGDL